MPAATPHTATYAPPSAADTPAPDKQDTFCTAPSDGGIRTKQNLTPFQRGELKDFTSAMMQRLYATWVRHMPRSANDPWIQGKSVLLRFEILPNGSVRDPLVMMSSGRSDYDGNVLRALTSGQPYTLPDGFTEPLRGCFLFQYNPRPGDPAPVDPFAPKPHKTHQ
jgi:hypothetical protein